MASWEEEKVTESPISLSSSLTHAHTDFAQAYEVRPLRDDDYEGEN